MKNSVLKLQRNIFFVLVAIASALSFAAPAVALGSVSDSGMLVAVLSRAYTNCPEEPEDDVVEDSADDDHSDNDGDGHGDDDGNPADESSDEPGERGFDHDGEGPEVPWPTSDR
jgi:hypothetical protein